MFVLPTFNLGVIGSLTVPYIFNDSLTFPTIQVFNTQEEITSAVLPPPNFTLVHAKDTDRLLLWDGSVWASYNADVIFNSYSLDFDGTNDYMTMGSNALFNTGSAFSYSGWVKLDSYSNTYQTVAQFKTNHSNGFQLLLSNASGYHGLNIGSNDTTNMMKIRTNGNISSTFLSWTHIAMTYNGSGGSTSSNYKIYINGSEVNTTTNSAYATLTNFNSIGAGNNGGAFRTNGLIDEVAIFNSELSASDVTAIYGIGTPTDIGTDGLNLNPVSWWRMGDNDGGTGTTITDQGSGGNNGTINGATFSTTVR